MVGDSCSKKNFKATREHSGPSSITEHGKVFINQASLERIYYQYYSKLYTARPESDVREEAGMRLVREPRVGSGEKESGEQGLS
jgi:hypothetical protein